MKNDLTVKNAKTVSFRPEGEI